MGRASHFGKSVSFSCALRSGRPTSRRLSPETAGRDTADTTGNARTQGAPQVSAGGMDSPSGRKESIKIADFGDLAESSRRVPRTPRRLRAPATAPVVLPLAAGGLLAVGALVALTSGGVGPTALLVLTSVIVAATAFVERPRDDCDDAAHRGVHRDRLHPASLRPAARRTAGLARRGHADRCGGNLLRAGGDDPRRGPAPEHTDECEHARAAARARRARGRHRPAAPLGGYRLRGRHAPPAHPGSGERASQPVARRRSAAVPAGRRGGVGRRRVLAGRRDGSGLSACC